MKKLYSLLVVLSISIGAIAQSYTADYPNVTDIEETTATITSNIDFILYGNAVGVNTYYIIQLSSETAPSISDVTSTGTNITISNSSTTFYGYLTDLSSSSDYIIYTVTQYFSLSTYTTTTIETVSPTEISFTTATTTPPPSIATDGYSPADDATAISVDQDLALTFSENIQVVSGSSANLIIYNSDNIEFASFGVTNGNISITDATLTVTHSDFTEGTSYYVIIEDGFIESSGTEEDFGGISSTTEWNFTTSYIAPVISTYSPVDNSTAIRIDEALSLTFTEDITIGSAGSIYIMQTSDDVEFVSYDITSTNIDIDGSTLTISHLDFNGSTEYYILIDAGFVKSTNSAVNFDGISSTTEWSFTTDSYKTWNGTSSDFDETDNWTGTGSSVIIPADATYQPILSSSASINNMTIEAGASLEITSTGDLTIDETLILESSLESSIGNANLLNYGTLSLNTGATVNIEQEVGGETEGVRESVYISSPVDGATMENANISYALYKRDAQTASWEELTSTEEMTAGTGYLAYGYTSEIISFSGDINNTEVGPLTMYRTTSPNNYGWNLVGNPFPCSIDWEYITDNGHITNLDYEFYILNDDIETYGVYNSEGTDARYVNLDSDNPENIPSCHSFWVKVTLGETTGSITFPTEARVNTHYSYLKSSETNSSEQIRFAGINSNNIEDELLIAFDSDATDDDDTYDSEKRFSSKASLMQLYTIHSDKDYVIDTYNNYTDSKTIKVGYQTGESGTYNISLTELTNIEDNATIQLEDMLNDSIKTMNLNDTYSFTSESGTFESRFLIHITPLISTDIAQTTTEINNSLMIYNVNSNIYILLDEQINPQYKLFDVSGKLLQNGLLNAGVLNKINCNYDGIIIVQVISDKQTCTQKIYLKK